MASLAESLAQSSAFKLPVSGASTSLAVKENEQLFLASGRTLLAVDLTSAAHSYKVFDLGHPYNIESIHINNSQDLLALVCKKSIVIVFLRRIPFGDSGQPWRPLKFVLGEFDTNIVSVAWHPASCSNSELVVLTENALQSFDLIISTTKPTFRSTLSNLGMRENPTSIAFGSPLSLSGSLSLYLCSPSGEVHSIFPFIYPNFYIGASKRAVDLFVAETQELLDTVEQKYPPRVIAGHPSNNDLLNQLNFGLHLQNQIESPLIDCSDPLKVVRLIPTYVVPIVTGSFAQVSKGSKILLVDTNSTTSCLVAFNDTDTLVELAYLGHLCPQVMSRARDIPRPDAPNDAGLKKRGREKHEYSRPKKGFGFVVDDDDDEESVEENQIATQNNEYSKLWEIYELKIKCMEFIHLHQKLTTLSCEKYKKSSLGPLMIGSYPHGRILLGINKKIQMVDCLHWFEEFQDNFPLGFTEFYTTKTNFAIEKPIAAFALFDNADDPTPYVFIRSNSGETVLVGPRVEGKPSSNDKPDPSKAISTKLLHETGLSGADLRSMLRQSPSATFSFTSKTRNTEDLVALTKITNLIRSHSHQLSKFIIALNSKIEVQQKRNLLNGNLVHGGQKLEEFNERSSMYKERIDKLFERQKGLLKRGDDIEKDILNRFESSKKSTSLPLSQAERSWMRELNDLRETVVSTKEGESLQERVQNLSYLLESFKGAQQAADESNDLSDDMKKLLLNNSLVNVLHHMLRQGGLIEAAKERLQLDADSVDALVGV